MSEQIIRTYRVELVGTVEALAPDEAQETAGRLLAGIGADGRTMPLDGPGSWAPELKRITEVVAVAGEWVPGGRAGLTPHEARAVTKLATVAADEIRTAAGQYRRNTRQSVRLAMGEARALLAVVARVPEAQEYV